MGTVSVTEERFNFVQFFLLRCPIIAPLQIAMKRLMKDPAFKCPTSSGKSVGGVLKSWLLNDTDELHCYAAAVGIYHLVN